MRDIKSEIELYIHIPFCIRKCNYCDFLSFPSDAMACGEKRAYVEALCQEIRATGPLAKDWPVRSIFIGGGTPSILPVEDMAEILREIVDSFSVKEDAEISMEANPGTLNKEKLLGYRAMGINRLSIGLQSTEDACLEKLGRIHNYQQFLDNYQAAREAGFDNINIDLMSALPGQTLDSYEDTLHKVLQLQPEHISSYSLILEEGTPFYEDDALIDLLPDEDTERKMYERTKEILLEAGYERYEISNYARPGRECRHNLGYWDDVPYLGMGLGASSYWKGARFSNERDLKAYLDQSYVEPEKREDYHLLTREEEMEECMFLGLRKMAGVDMSSFKERFGLSLEEIYGEILTYYKKAGLLEEENGKLRLTDGGIDVSNHIFADFLLEDEKK